MTGLAEVFIKQVCPLRIQAVDQIDFLLARASFDLFFSDDGRFDIIAAFKIDQLGDVIFFREGTAFARFVFQDSALQVVGHAGVENGVVGVGHDVDAILPVRHTSPIQGSREGPP